MMDSMPRWTGRRYIIRSILAIILILVVLIAALRLLRDYRQPEYTAASSGAMRYGHTALRFRIAAGATREATVDAKAGQVICYLLVDERRQCLL